MNASYGISYGRKLHDLCKLRASSYATSPEASFQTQTNVWDEFTIVECKEGGKAPKNEGKVTSTSTPTQKKDKKHSSDALSDGIVSYDLLSWPQMLVRRNYHT